MVIRNRWFDFPFRFIRNRSPLLLHRVNKIWLIVGGIFSALEPLAFLAMALLQCTCIEKEKKSHQTKLRYSGQSVASIVSFIGAGLLGFAHTLPQTNIYTHGTLVTAMHGHYAFWGAYAMIVLAIISYALPNITGKNYTTAQEVTWRFGCLISEC